MVVSVMPCTAKKFEAKRDEMNSNGTSRNDIDISITTRELAQLIKQMNIDLLELEEEDFDDRLASQRVPALFSVKPAALWKRP